MPWYVKIGDLNGGSTDQAHMGWFEAESFTFDVEASMKPPVMGGSGQAAGQRKFTIDESDHETRDALATMRNVDSLAILMQMAAMGTTVNKVIAERVDEQPGVGGKVEKRVMVRFELENIHLNVRHGGGVTEVFFNYNKSGAAFGESVAKPPQPAKK